jgi:O-antigen/teichoic acid export membrane protein
VNWLCTSLLLSRPGGPGQVAAYLAANQWFAIILFVPINLTQVTLPMVSRAFRDTGRLFGPAARRMLAVTLGASGTVGAVLLLAMPLLLKLYSPAIQAAMPVFAVIAVNGMIVAVQVATGQMLVAAGRVRANLLFNLGWAVIYLTATATLVTDAVGLASGRLVAYAAHGMATLAFLVWADRRQRQPGT